MPVFANVTQGPVSPIKSLQRAVFATSSTGGTNITISAVDMAKAVVIPFGEYLTPSGGVASFRAQMTSGTNIQIIPSANGVAGGFTVVEYW